MYQAKDGDEDWTVSYGGVPSVKYLPPILHAPCSDLHSLVRLIQHSFFFKPCADIKLSSAKFMILGKDVCKV